MHARYFFNSILEWYFRRYSSAVSGSGGTAILVRASRGVTVFSEWKHDQSGRVCTEDLLCRWEMVRGMWLHARNDPVERKTFSANLGQYVETSAKTIVGGYFKSVFRTSHCSRGRKQGIPVPGKLLSDQAPCWWYSYKCWYRFHSFAGRVPRAIR